MTTHPAWVSPGRRSSRFHPGPPSEGDGLLLAGEVTASGPGRVCACAAYFPLSPRGHVHDPPPPTAREEAGLRGSAPSADTSVRKWEMPVATPPAPTRAHSGRSRRPSGGCSCTFSGVCSWQLCRESRDTSSRPSLVGESPLLTGFLFFIVVRTWTMRPTLVTALRSTVTLRSTVRRGDTGDSARQTSRARPSRVRTNVLKAGAVTMSCYQQGQGGPVSKACHTTSLTGSLHEGKDLP